MKKKVAIMDIIHPNLLEPPHYIGELIRFVAGEWMPDPSQQEQLVAHLTTCSYCRVALIALLLGEQEHEQRSNSSSETLVHKFVALHHDLEVQDYEYIGAYAEAIVAMGEVLATKRFSILAEHIKRCSHCQSLLDETLTFLNEPEETADVIYRSNT